MTTLTTVIIALATLAAPQEPGPKAATESVLVEAEHAFVIQEYDAVVTLLSPLASEGAVQDTATRTRLLERLAASHWFLDTYEDARRVFQLLLKVSPEHRLDPIFYPRDLVTFFNGERMKLNPGGGMDDGPAAPPKFIIKEIASQEVPVLAYLMPFGVGQFANGDVALGAVLAALQVIGLAANLAGWLTVELLRGEGGYIADRQLSRAELAQGMWIAGTALASASYIYSVTDGLIKRAQEPDVRWRLQDQPPEEVPESLESNFDWEVVPATSPGTLGLSIGGRF